MALFLLACITVMVAAIALTFVMHAILGVPYIPTSKKACIGMLELADIKGNETVYDLGAGDARLLIEAKKRYPGIRAIGCEIVPTIWILGMFRILFSGQRVSLRMRNAFHERLQGADVVLLYLFPHLLQSLSSKFDQELKPGTRVVSLAFKIPGKTPVSQRTLSQLGSKNVQAFLYRW